MLQFIFEDDTQLNEITFSRFLYIFVDIVVNPFVYLPV